jgi:serine/threonine protein kinase
LRDEINKNEQLTEAFIWNITLQIVLGMAKLNSQGLVHGDLRPNTIFLKDDVQVKLVDCGMLELKDALSKAKHEQVLLSP